MLVFLSHKEILLSGLIAIGGVSITSLVYIGLVKVGVVGDVLERIGISLGVMFSYIFFFQYYLLKQYKKQKQRLEQEIMLRKVSNSLFYNVLEADLTLDQVLGDNALALSRFLGTHNNSYEAIIEAIVHKLVREDFQEEYLQRFSRQNILKMFASKQTNFEYEFVERSDGVNYHWVKTYVCVYQDYHSGNVRIVSHVKNIQKEKERELAFINQAQRDSLTNLYNKMVTQDLIINTLENIKPNSKHALYLIDLDNFKNVNDSFGHAAGDIVLTQIADKLRQSFRETDIVGRIGGDEFLVMLKNIHDLDVVAKKAEQISTICREIIGKNGHRIEISLSIGICIIPLDGQSFEEIFKKADKALYKAKNRGKNSFAFYTDLN